MVKKLFSVLVVLLILITGAFSYAETFGVKKKRPKPHEFGSVVINNYSRQANMAPVVFNHWVHRARFTCRLCHVDIGFAMQAGGTNIMEADNENGLYCGSCHNGTRAFGPKTRDVEGNTIMNCIKCHSQGEKVQFKNDFYDFRKQMPQERFGNGIDWMKAEDEGLIKIKDYLEGVSIKRDKIENPKEFGLKPLEKNMPEIIFSHEKHTVWNGCELCHPEIFGVKKGGKPYSMEEIFDGKYCGLCHGPVAFPNIDCQRCHTKQVN
ncbi:MAG: hypothetical protein KKG47_12760 [Proteobacteria bacterium]|nr:hypothetical protein [Pseudomonadota bacterium]MBU1738723.1 hypothetical protein [Pseudomonadota bacterium]